MSDGVMTYEDWLRGCVHHDGRNGYVTLPCDEVLKIADFIEKLRTDRKTDGKRKEHTMRPIDADPLKEEIARAIRIDCVGGWNPIIQIIDYAPTIEADRPKGEWEEIDVIPKAYDIAGVKTWASKMRCNQCGFTTFAIEGHFAQYNFCPRCGADMRGE